MTTKLYERIRFRGQPQAHPKAVVTHDCGGDRGAVRFTVLTSCLLRLEWSATGEFEDRSTYAFPTRYVENPPAFNIAEDGETLTLTTDDLTLRYRLGGGRFTSGDLTVTFSLHGAPVTWRPGMTNSGNLLGTRRTLDGCAGDAALDPGLLSRDGWAVFDDSTNVVFGEDGWVAARPDFDLQDWYFFGYGHDYQEALREYTRFGGEVPLIPRFVLGGWWSRYWAYSEQDLRDLVREFEVHDVPLDVFVIDMDWHTPDGWTGYTWNRELFPDPPAFLDWLHDKGLRVTLNLHPAEGIQPFEEVYPEFADAMGIDPESGEGVPFRIADKTFVKHYFELIHHRMEDEGVDFWWMDWQQGEISEVKGLDPLPWINHLHFNDIKRRGVRPMLYSRWGGLGNHRYYIGFSGDTYVGWDALQFQPFMTATASNVLYGWWSHDIGGHMGGATEPELYARWVQFGAVSPVLRLHSTKDPRCERRPWAYPEPYASAAEAAFQWRYRLIPYLYTMARVAADTSVALCRPMYYESPREEAAYATRYQYYLGDVLIVAPIVFPSDPETGLAAIDVWVPEGTWTAYDTLETFTGPRWVRLVGDIRRIPMLVKVGGILPLAPGFEDQPAPALASGTTDAQPQDALVLAVFPGEGATRVYRDDGVTNLHQQGHYEWLPITTMQSDDGRSWYVKVEPIEGRCPDLPDRISYRVELRGCGRPQAVTVNGEEARWDYDKAAPVCIVQVPDVAVEAGFELVVTAESEIIVLDSAFNRRQQRKDVGRLAGAEVGQSVADLEMLLARRDKLSSAAFSHAIARLGGPFCHGIEFVTPAEAAQQWGRLIVGGPTDGEPMDVVVRFAANFEGEIDVQELTWRGITNDLIIDTPFAFAGELRRGEWSAAVTMRWRGIEIADTFKSAPLFPSVTTWHVVVYDHDEGSLELGAALSVIEGRPGKQTDDKALVIRVDTFAQDPMEADNFNEPFILRMADHYEEQLASDMALGVYFVTVCSAPTARAAVLEIFGAGPMSVYVNGQEVALPEPDVDPSIPDFFRPPPRTVPFQLQQGANRIAVQTRAPGPDASWWRFGGRVLTPEGEDLVDLAFS